jgi:hypothetical protein
LGCTPTWGATLEFLDQSDLIAPRSQESAYVQLCEKQPEKLFTFRRFQSSKDNFFYDPFFKLFCQENPDLVASIGPQPSWWHADQSKESFQKGVAKYCRNLPEIQDDQNWELAFEWLCRDVGKHCQGSTLTPMNVVLEKSELGTSPGVVHRLLHETKGCFLSSEDAPKFINSHFDSLKNFGSDLVIFGSYEKDELRPFEKVLAKKSRLFMSAPTEHFLSSQVLSLDMNEKLISKANSLECPVLLGFNLFHGNFDRLARRLMKFLHQICGDFGGYDSSFRELFFVYVVYFRWLMLCPADRTPENLRRLGNLYRSVWKSPVAMPDGSVYYIFGNPSGQGNTGMDNSLVLYMILAWCWISNGNPPDLEVFKQNVYLAVFGDDSVVAVDEHYFPTFNPDSISSLVSSIGMEIDFSPNLEFLGHFIGYSEDLSQYVPIFPTHKAIASLLYNGKPDFFSLASKAMSIRLDTFTNKEVFPVVDKYCFWLLQVGKNRFGIDLSDQYHSLNMLSSFQQVGGRLNSYSNKRNVRQRASSCSPSSCEQQQATPESAQKEQGVGHQD